MNLTIESLYNLDECYERSIFDGLKYPWEALPKIKAFLLEFAKTLPSNFERIEEAVWVGKGTTIAKTVLIKGPAIIGYNCELRQCAFIRENVIIGNEVTIGNSTELKNSLLFNRVQVPHFNYVGDSILGYKSHLGAGVICSNLKSNGGNVSVKVGEACIDTGLRKFGAMVGDNSEVGCNSVLNPGTVIGKNSIVYPLTPVRGYVPENHILKNNGELVARR
ncbi:MAG TPA: UDP-N-acetylglucosamine pyrophosphorylase [Clostridia bacterium]|nr:UDP-N-acetylglucosamine pyrophosphorylase [Clostridia bacterium]